ncbi:FecR family protein [Flavobacterium sp. K5-23]|uniref:FecR family protein n=1 Tax=Flavobacterium sp. K5-23 TaxID=2746225 RepID=UPI0020102170|nr:FecR family protein [Flavobacterium sp. K5-23]UQD55830.1 FecR domain-containing protein [Flavobacterium sp. K5-23]
MKESDLIQFIIKKGNSEFDKEVISWINSSSENQALFNKIKATHVIDTLDNNFEKISPNKQYKAFLKKNNKSKNKRRLFLKIASAIMIPLLLTTYLYYSNSLADATANHFTAYTSSAKEQKKITLGDGTIVWLNAESKIVVSNQYNKEERRISLYGEAFFDVVKNKNKPFIVETASGIKVKVLGTTFNVKSYSSEKNVETTLVTGKVELYDKKEIKPLLTLSPKQKATFSKKEKELSVAQVTTEDITSWKSGRLIFNKTPLDEFALNIERWFGVKVIVDSKGFKDYSFSGVIEKSNSIEDIMRVLEISSNLNCSYTKNTKTLLIKSK